MSKINKKNFKVNNRFLDFEVLLQGVEPVVCHFDDIRDKQGKFRTWKD
jgi:hypothetical protein